MKQPDAQTSPAAASPDDARVLIIDDHPIVRYGLRFSISRIPGLVICAEAGGLDDALALAKEHQPKLVILDLVLGGRDGCGAVSQIRQTLPKAAILVFSMSPEELFAEKALKAGANGYLVKTDGFEKLADAIRQILQGGTYLSERMMQRVNSDTSLGRSQHKLSCLTAREFQIFHRLGEGKTTSEVAEELNLSVKTVATHRENMKSKLGVASGSSLNRLAISFLLEQGGSSRRRS